MLEIELHPAYVWDCDNCGREQFARAVVVEMTPDDIAEMQRRYGGDAAHWQTGRWLTRPAEVTCAACGTEYVTTDDDDEEDDEEPATVEDVARAFAEALECRRQTISVTDVLLAVIATILLAAAIGVVAALFAG